MLIEHNFDFCCVVRVMDPTRQQPVLAIGITNVFGPENYVLSQVKRQLANLEYDHVELLSHMTSGDRIEFKRSSYISKNFIEQNKAYIQLELITKGELINRGF